MRITAFLSYGSSEDELVQHLVKYLVLRIPQLSVFTVASLPHLIVCSWDLLPGWPVLEVELWMDHYIHCYLTNCSNRNFVWCHSFILRVGWAELSSCSQLESLLQLSLCWSKAGIQILLWHLCSQDLNSQGFETARAPWASLFPILTPSIEPPGFLSVWC